MADDGAGVRHNLHLRHESLDTNIVRDHSEFFARHDRTGGQQSLHGQRADRLQQDPISVSHALRTARDRPKGHEQEWLVSVRHPVGLQRAGGVPGRNLRRDAERRRPVGQWRTAVEGRRKRREGALAALGMPVVGLFSIGDLA